MDMIVGRVLRKFLDRSEKGIQKYDTTLDRDDLGLDEWLEHLQTELMDATLYIEKLRSGLPPRKESDVSERKHAVEVCNAGAEPEVPGQRITSHPFRPTPNMEQILERVRDEANRGS